jgi:hypothetical protein
MNYKVIIILLINIHYYLARDYNLACIYTNFEAGSFIHCDTKEQTLHSYEYDMCETKPTPDLEYYQCIYKIYHIPADKIAIFSKLHHVILKCKDCEYTRNWKFKNPKLCTNKAEVEYYKTYNDCLLNYINANEEELESREGCARSCHSSFGILDYSECAYGCYKNITEKIIELEPKVTTFVIDTQTKENNNEENKKSSALLNFNSLSIYLIITLTPLITLANN